MLVHLEFDIWEGEDVDIAAHLVDSNRDDLVSAGVSDVDYSLYDLSSDTPDTALDTDTGIQGTVMQASLTTGNGWTENGTGYTFRHTVPASGYTPTGGHTYRAQYTITRSSGGVQYLVALIRVKSIL